MGLFTRYALKLLAPALLVLMSSTFAMAGNPYNAHYSLDNNNIFWFIQISDIHIGTSGSQDSGNLAWVTGLGPGNAYGVINPEFIIASGDLTDGTNGLPFPLPGVGPFQEEWDEYASILNSPFLMDADVYYDSPGNHDQYNETIPLDLYLNNSIQGLATAATQQSWVRSFPFGEYHFINVATPDPDYTNPTVDFLRAPGGLRPDEINYISSELIAHQGSKLTFIFGHHPLSGLDYGRNDFISLLQGYHVSMYAFGHTHDYSAVLDGGTLYFNIASLGKSSINQYAVFAVDNDGLSASSANVNQWPVVLITAPVDRNLGGENSYAYPVPFSTTNPIRALVFDADPVTGVQYSIDGGTPLPMEQVASFHPYYPYLWQTTTWDTTALSIGEHTVQVEAAGTTTGSDQITVTVCEGDITSVDASSYPSLVIDGCNFSSDALVAFASLTGLAGLETPASVTSTRISVTAPRDALFFAVINHPYGSDFRVSDVTHLSLTPVVSAVDTTAFPALTITGDAFNVLMAAFAYTGDGVGSILFPDLVDPLTETVSLIVNGDTCSFALVQFPFTTANISNMWDLCGP